MADNAVQAMAVQAMRDWMFMRSLREQEILRSSTITDDVKKRTLREEGLLLPLIAMQFAEVHITVDFTPLDVAASDNFDARFDAATTP